MSKDIVTLMDGSLGLNNAQDPVMLKTTENGVELRKAINVFHDATGRVHRRKGYAEETTGNFHSGFANKRVALVVDVAASKVKRFHGGSTLVDVLSLTQSLNKMYYVSVNDKIYFSNGVEKGAYVNDAYTAWESSTKPDTFGAEHRALVSIPPCKHLAYYNGRIVFALDNLIGHTWPFAYDWTDLSQDTFLEKSSVRMIQPIAGGIYVSDESDTYFIKYQSPSDPERLHVLSEPAVEGTNIQVEPWIVQGLFEFPITGTSALWTSASGIMLGMPGGAVINLTRDKLKYDSALKGAAILKGSLYHSLLHP